MQSIHSNRNEGGIPWQGDELASHSMHASLQDSGMQQLPKHVRRLKTARKRMRKWVNGAPKLWQLVRGTNTNALEIKKTLPVSQFNCILVSEARLSRDVLAVCARIYSVGLYNLYTEITKESFPMRMLK